MVSLKIPNNKYGEAISELSSLIKGSCWEDRCFLVGGSCRDIIMGKNLHDIDIVVNYPNGGVLFAEWLTKELDCYKKDSNPCVFKRYGTARFCMRSINSLSNISIECTQTRKDSYSNANGDTSSIYGSMEQDALMRDLTINSIYINLSNGNVIDPTNKGFNDIKDKMLGTPNKSDITFKDDPLRMLRVIRFSVNLGFSIKKETWFGIVRNSHLIKTIAKERVLEEFKKIITSERPSLGLDKMVKSGLMQHIMPIICKLKNVPQGSSHDYKNVFEHTMKTVDLTKPLFTHRMAALLHDIGKITTIRTNELNGKITFKEHEEASYKIANEILKQLGVSSEESHSILTSIKYHMNFSNFGKRKPSIKSVRKFLYNIGVSNLDCTLDLIDANNKSVESKTSMHNQVECIWDSIKRIDNDVSKSGFVMPVNGKDIMKYLNIKQSPVIGVILSKLIDDVFDNSDITKEECLEKAKKYFEEEIDNLK